MDCEYCGKNVDDCDWGDVLGAIVCLDCQEEAMADQGVVDDGINGFKRVRPEFEL